MTLMTKSPLFHNRKGWISSPGINFRALSALIENTANNAGELRQYTGIWNGMPSTSAQRPASLSMRAGLAKFVSLQRTLQFFQNQWENVLRGVFSNEYVEVAVVRYGPKGMVILAMRVEKL